jgi:DNA excision repair protein ERCC-6
VCSYTLLGIEYVLRKLQRFEGTQGLVVLITYDGLRRHKESLSMIEWTGVCLDEGQKIRNPDTDISAVCKVLPSYHRIILSGTPIQNSLKELWSLFDFIYPGRLGALSVFELEFCEPIRAGGYRNASKLQAEVAIRCAATLQRIVRPYLLRRKKDDLSSITKLPKKTEQILFCKLSERQKEIYRTILASSEVQSVMDKRMMPFRAINTLRKLCNHPDLVFQTGRIVWQDEKNPAQNKGKKSVGGRNPGRKKSNYGQDYGEDDSDTESPMMDPSKIRWEDSGKLMVLWKVLPLWYSEGHKVLLFTQTHSMLNLLELMMKQFSFRFMRLDGMTPVSKREGIIETFNKDPTVFLMILTTRTGGVGISLTAANRVVLIDPDWNPQVRIDTSNSTI